MNQSVGLNRWHSTSRVARHLYDSNARWVVYFDGACPLCRREIAHYQGQKGAAAIVWVDAASCDPAALGGDLSRDAALARLHARRADGSLVSGVAAFAIIWSRLHAYRWLAPIISRRPVLTILEASYSVFLRLRTLWRRPAGASKALQSSSCAAAATYASSRIRVNAISPGFMHTPGTASLIASDAAREGFARQYPLGGIGTPDEAAQTIEWLLSSSASRITGQAIPIDGVSSVRPLVR